jgi:hypothetical protein
MGVAATAPTERLHVNGAIFIGDSTYKTTSVSSYSAKSNVLILDGNFDTGTVINSVTSANKIRIHNIPTWIAGFGMSTGQLNYHSGENHVFWTGSTSSNYGTEVMRIASSCNVGIGTATPGYKLDVSGDINFTGTLRQNGTAFSSGTASGFTLGSGTTYTTCNVVIGTVSPGKSLDVVGTIRTSDLMIKDGSYPIANYKFAMADNRAWSFVLGLLVPTPTFAPIS